MKRRHSILRKTLVLLVTVREIETIKVEVGKQGRKGRCRETADMQGDREGDRICKDRGYMLGNRGRQGIHRETGDMQGDRGRKGICKETGDM